MKNLGLSEIDKAIMIFAIVMIIYVIVRAVIYSI